MFHLPQTFEIMTRKRERSSSISSSICSSSISSCDSPLAESDSTYYYYSGGEGTNNFRYSQKSETKMNTYRKFSRHHCGYRKQNLLSSSYKKRFYDESEPQHQNVSESLSKERTSTSEKISDVCSRSKSPSASSCVLYCRDPKYSDLPLEWWERGEGCKEAKAKHTERVDRMFDCREDLVFMTTLHEDDIVLESNMFPYDTPYGVEHFTLWSRHDLAHEEIVDFVDCWLRKHLPQVRRWQYDDNQGERSFLIFHVHIFIETVPFSFHARPELEYFPPHTIEGAR